MIAAKGKLLFYTRWQNMIFHRYLSTFLKVAGSCLPEKNKLCMNKCSPWKIEISTRDRACVRRALCDHLAANFMVEETSDVGKYFMDQTAMSALNIPWDQYIAFGAQEHAVLFMSGSKFRQASDARQSRVVSDRWYDIPERNMATKLAG